MGLASSTRKGEVTVLDLVVLTRDEADRIGACLLSVPGARAWVLDAGSTDTTVDVARSFGATVIPTDWPGFAAQRHRSLGVGEAPFQLFLDADERLSPAGWRAVQGVLAAPGPAVGWTLARSTVYAGRALRHGRAWPDRRIRLVRRGFARWSNDPVHEVLRVDGPIADLDGWIDHHPYRSFADHLRTIDRYSQLHADALIERGARAGPFAPAAHAAWHLTRALLGGAAWDGAPGLAFAGMGAVHAGLKWRRVRCGSR